MKGFPSPGESVVGDTLHLYLGGKGVNQCTSIARLGGNVSMIDMVGDDENGHKFLSFLEEEGIDHRGVFVDPTRPTGLAQIQINASSENRICVIPRANMGFGYEEAEKVRPILQEAAIYANAMGALTVQTKGAIPSLSTKEKVEEFLANYR